MSKPARKASGTSDYNAPIPESILAQVWVLTEEGNSQRSTAEQLKISPSQVHKILGEDPVRLEALRARQREARATRWKQVENAGLDELIAWLEEIRKYRETPIGKKTMSQREEMRLTLLPRLVNSLRQAAETGTKTVQLLTGGLTERVGTDREHVETEMSSEQLINTAIELDAIEILPPRLREAAKREKARRK